MTLTCPECRTRYRFDEARVPERGLPVRCARCRSVFRAFANGECLKLDASPRSSTGSAAAPSAQPARPSRRSGGSLRADQRSRPSPDNASAPADGAPPAVSNKEIQRLTRIILSDIVIYSPEKAEKAIIDGRFAEAYRQQIDEGRRMIKGRFPNEPTAITTFEGALAELLDAKRKELLGSAFAL